MGLPKHQVVRLSPKVDNDDSMGVWIAAYAVPIVATVATRPRVKDADIGLMEGGLESQ